jgi:predicted RecA/RadA family phage recombinase
MAQNYIESGDVLDYTVPAGETVVSGSPVIVGDLIGVALSSGTEGQVVAVMLEGVFELPKATGAIAHGATVYWNATTGKVTTTATDNTLIGYAWKAEISAATTIRVRLVYC